MAKYYRVKVIGRNETIDGISEVAGQQLIQLKKDFVNGGKKNDKAVTIKSLETTLSKIDWIDEDKQTKDHLHQTKYKRQLHENYESEHARLRKLSPQEKAKRLGVFSMMWYGATAKKEIPETVKERVIKAQEQFFKENPNRIWANPNIFTKFLKEQSTEYQDNRGLLQRSALLMATLAVSEDVKEANKV